MTVGFEWEQLKCAEIDHLMASTYVGKFPRWRFFGVRPFNTDTDFLLIEANKANNLSPSHLHNIFAHKSFLSSAGRADNPLIIRGWVSGIVLLWICRRGASSALILLHSRRNRPRPPIALTPIVMSRMGLNVSQQSRASVECVSGMIRDLIATNGSNRW